MCSGLFASAVPVGTAFEAGTLWAQANGYIPVVTWAAHRVWCAALLLVIPVWREAHFYAIHRLIHWPPLYRSVHRLHDTNVNPGPWSGLAMHPVEHVLLDRSLKSASCDFPPTAPRLFAGPGP
jgi:sterol desaturase/sphingolipid hydroxylase (fatty acid hydroxylase superfamily)